MTIQDLLRAQLAMVAWREGYRHGGVNNMLAIAFVVRNRVRAGWMGGDWMKVLANHDCDQWSAGLICDMEAFMGDADFIIPDFHDPGFRELLVKIDSVFDGTLEDRMTEGALYYCELDQVFREGWKERILNHPEEHKKVANVGVVSFFL